MEHMSPGNRANQARERYSWHQLPRTFQPHSRCSRQLRHYRVCQGICQAHNQCSQQLHRCQPRQCSGRQHNRCIRCYLPAHHTCRHRMQCSLSPVVQKLMKQLSTALLSRRPSTDSFDFLQIHIDHHRMLCNQIPTAQRQSPQSSIFQPHNLHCTDLFDCHQLHSDQHHTRCTTQMNYYRGHRSTCQSHS